MACLLVQKHVAYAYCEWCFDVLGLYSGQKEQAITYRGNLAIIATQPLCLGSKEKGILSFRALN